MDTLNNIVANLPKNHNELADFIYNGNQFPVFTCIHYCLVALSMRKRDGARDYAHHHPFASLFVYVTSCSGGSLIMNFLLGRPIIQIYLNTTNVVLASLIWYFVLFSPLDLVYNVTQIKFVKMVLLGLKEIHRIRNIINGMEITSKLYPDSFLLSVLIGSVRGSGAKFTLRPLDSFVRGTFTSDNEFLKPTFSTKHSVVSSVVIYLVRTGVIHFDERVSVYILVAVAAAIQITMLLTDIKDPYEKLENMIYYIFLRMPDEVVNKDSKKKTD